MTKTIGTSWTNIASFNWQPGTGFNVTFYLDARYDSTKNSVEKNESYIYTRLRSVVHTGQGSGSSYSFSCSYCETISGSAVWYLANETILESSKQTIKHSDDGSKEITLSAAGSISYIGLNFSMSETVTLETIPRATTCPDVSGIIEGSSVNIALNPASTSFKHSIKVVFGSLTGYLNASGGISTSEVILSSASPIMNFGTDFYAYFTGLSSTGTLTLNTYSGSTLVGTKTGKLSISVDQAKCKPTATGTVKDTNATTIALTGDANVIVKGFSNALITPTITPSAAKDTKTTISSKYINNQKFTTSTVTVNGATTKDFKLSMTNSRTIQGSSNLSASSLLNYIKLSLTAEFERTTSTSNDMKVSFSGNFFDNYFDAAKTKKNSLSISWGVKEKGTTSDYTSGGTFKSTDYTISNNKFTAENVVLVNPLSEDGTWDSTKGYDFIIYYSDLLVSANYKDSIKKGIPYFYWYVDADGKKHLVALDYLDVNGVIRINKEITLDISIVEEWE